MSLLVLVAGKLIKIFVAEELSKIAIRVSKLGTGSPTWYV